ncbi:MarR family winged helix-turn-helix transcriptional regulator [Geosporobacter ferrireducens]|uniref:HTH marR-type domain-containing protein n=1 Tax=Geosporobacter ferrireducens TaxID=1424294 RepID=A0A1D8GHE9_9FIRM|nr:MarR family transcriptional regulator [Geosporobacter ferrireducens]AOT70338.1 hypothetical protein Gferi_12485 [Geosporobacter ferrireducens]
MHQNEDVGFLIKLIHDCIERKSNQKLKLFDLTLSQGRVLAYLNERKGLKTSQKDIEDYLEVAHPTVVGILKRLESKGFITSEFDAEDKRVKNVYLTQNEASVHRAMCEFKIQMEQKLLQGLTDTQVEELLYLLNLIYENIQEQ